MSERHLHQDMTEAERRLSNVVMLGQVAELDAERALARTQAGLLVQINAGAVRRLDQRKAAAALEAARRA